MAPLVAGLAVTVNNSTINTMKLKNKELKLILAALDLYLECSEGKASKRAAKLLEKIEDELLLREVP